MASPFVKKVLADKDNRRQRLQLAEAAEHRRANEQAARDEVVDLVDDSDDDKEVEEVDDDQDARRRR